MDNALPRSFYERDVVQVAHELWGKQLVRVTDQQLTVGQIVELGAYLARGDPANHACRSKTRRKAAAGTCPEDRVIAVGERSVGERGTLWPPSGTALPAEGRHACRPAAGG